MDNILPVLLSWESGLFGEGGEKDGYCTEYEERLLHSSSEPNTREGLLHNSKLDTREGLLHNSSKPNGENSVLEACFLAGGSFLAARGGAITRRACGLRRWSFSGFRSSVCHSRRFG